MKPLKTLKIEWRHPPRADGRIPKIIKELRTQLKKKMIDIILIEKKLPANQLAEILFNDLPLEFLLDEARVRDNFCGTCVSPTVRKKIYSKISESLIKKAALKAVGLL